MKKLLMLLSMVVAIGTSTTSALAGVVLFAESPRSMTVGTEAPVFLKARLTESINALKTTIAVSPDSAVFVRFDDADSVVRLWLQRGVQADNGVVIEGVIPGGVGPAFTDVVNLGTLWVRPSAMGNLRIAFTDSQVYLNQPTPTLSDIDSNELVVRVGPPEIGQQDVPYVATVITSDVRVVRDEGISEGVRSLVFDIKTDRGTVDIVRIRERWLGVYGQWRDASNPSTLSDGFGLSILDVSLPDSVGGIHVVSIVPTTLKIVWILFAALLITTIGRYLKKRY